MDAYLADALHFQPRRLALFTAATNWLKRKLETPPARHARARQITYLRHLDRETLADMGIDVTVVGDAPPNLSSFNPSVVAINIFAGTSRQPGH